MLVAITPIDVPTDDNCWVFHFINDTDEMIESVTIRSVNYEWGGSGNSTAVGRSLGPVAPGTAVELLRETDTEVRTSISLEVRGAQGVFRISADAGRLYRASGSLVPIPILGVSGKLAVLETEIVTPLPGTVHIDDVGIQRWLANGEVEAVKWTELTKVEMVTTDEGPFSDDVFWVLHGREKGCVVPSEAPGSGVLLTRLQALPDFDNEALIAAMGSTENARFLLWEK